jgi:periplasmic protein TonB
MRTWTLVVSVVAHAAVVAAILVAPIFATADLPDPRRLITFESITPLIPSIPITAPRQPVQAQQATQTTPVAEPPDLPDDMPIVENTAPSIEPCEHPCGVVGVPIGDGNVGGDLLAPPPLQPPRNDPVRVGGVIRPPTRVVYVQPVYPPVPLAARKEATVILEAVIDEKGNVRELRVLRGNPLFDDAAMRAVARWQFTPTLLNGTTVPVVMTVTVAFSLTK